jgi:hypothetical protein
MPPLLTPPETVHGAVNTSIAAVLAGSMMEVDVALKFTLWGALEMPLITTELPGLKSDQSTKTEPLMFIDEPALTMNGLGTFRPAAALPEPFALKVVPSEL